MMNLPIILHHQHPTNQAYHHSSPEDYHQPLEHHYEQASRRPELYRDPNSQQHHPPQQDHQSSSRRLSHQGPMQPYRNLPVHATMPRRRPSNPDTTHRRSSTEYQHNPTFDHYY